MTGAATYQPLSPLAWRHTGVGRDGANGSRSSAIAIIVGALLVILALLRSILAFVRPRRRDESASIRARYRHLIVPVERVWQLPGVPVIDVADMDALARIAEHYDRSILHEATPDGDAFWVADESGQFRFTLCAAPCTTPNEVIEDSPLEAAIGDVYAGEPEFRGVVLASETRPATETVDTRAAVEDDWAGDDWAADHSASVLVQDI